MKKLIIALAAIIPTGLAAQQSGIESLMSKYEGRKGVTVMNLGESILSGMSDYMSDYLSAYTNDSYDDFDLSEYLGTTGCECQCGEECAADEKCFIAEELMIVDEEDGTDEIVFVAPPTILPEEDEEESDEEDAAEYGVQDYLNDMTDFRMIVYEKAPKKFLRDVKSTVSAAGYKNILSMNDGEDDIRVHMIEDGDNKDIVVVVGDKDEYMVINIVGKGNIMKLIEAIAKYL